MQGQNVKDGLLFDSDLGQQPGESSGMAKTKTDHPQCMGGRGEAQGDRAIIKERPAIKSRVAQATRIGSGFSRYNWPLTQANLFCRQWGLLQTSRHCLLERLVK